jgi:hypothetical protein
MVVPELIATPSQLRLSRHPSDLISAHDPPNILIICRLPEIETTPSTAILAAMDRPVPIENRTFHTHAFFVYAAFLVFVIVGCRQAAIILPFTGALVLVRFILAAILAPLPAYWHSKHRTDRREAALALYWVLAFSLTLPFIVDICARSGMPLQDINLARFDHMLGVNVPAIAAWTDRHPLAQILSETYPLLILYFIPAAALAPALFGRWVAAREFLIANLIGMIHRSHSLCFPAGSRTLVWISPSTTRRSGILSVGTPAHAHARPLHSA